MRSTSSAHRGIALFLCAVFALQGTGAAGSAFADRPPETCILLKLSAPSVSKEDARERMMPVPGLLLQYLNVRWTAPSASSAPPETKTVFPEADDASLELISRILADAIRSMDGMDVKEAEQALAKAEKEARKYRLSGRTRPLLAEILSRRGMLKLWEGNPKEAEELLARSRALRPGFSPDPALFSPAFMDAWSRSRHRPAAEAELLVQSIPPGALVSVDGKPQGTTPCRIRIQSFGPVRIRLSLTGYQDVEKEGQWLPGDSESHEWIMVRDRIATLGEMLVSDPNGKGSGKLLSELAKTAGASRVALLVLDHRDGKPVGRLFSSGPGDGDPKFLGEFEWRTGEDGTAEAAGKAARLLREAGWPGGKENAADSPWYHKWWIWAFVGALAIGAAAAAGGGGGGGSSGGSTGSIGVSF